MSTCTVPATVAVPPAANEDEVLSTFEGSRVAVIIHSRTKDAREVRLSAIVVAGI